MKRDDEKSLQRHDEGTGNCVERAGSCTISDPDEAKRHENDCERTVAN